MVAHMPRVVIFPALAVSKAIIMVPLTPSGLLGTQSVLPLLAMIWRRILVAMLLRFCFLRVPSVVIWQIILYLTRAAFFSFLYWVLSWLGRITRQMLQPSLSAAFPIAYISISRPFRLSYVPALTLMASNFTFSFLEVSWKVSRSMPVSWPEK